MAPSPTVSDLGKKVKAKYPGTYDDLADDDLGRRVKTKFPGSYDDFVEPSAAKPKASGGNYRSAEAKLGNYVLDTLSNVPSSAANLAKGIGHAVMHPIDTTGNMANAIVGGIEKPFQAVGNALHPNQPGTTPQIEAFDAATRAIKNRYGSPQAIANTVRTDPVGAAADVSAVTGGLSGLSRGGAALAERLSLPGAGTARTVADVAGTVSDWSNPIMVGGKIVSRFPLPPRMTPEGMYQSALRPSLLKKNLPKIESQVATGLKEGIPVSQKGLGKVRETIDDLLAKDQAKVAAAEAAGAPPINPLDVTKPLNRLKPTFANQVNPDADLSAISAAKKEFLDKHSVPQPFQPIQPNPYGGNSMVPAGPVEQNLKKQPIPLTEAAAEKTGTYRQLRGKYGELGSASVEAQKQLARGLKDEIAKRVPGLQGARESDLIALEGQLEKMVAREGNKNILGLVPATMSHNPTGFLASLALDNPAIKSTIAIALDRARKLQGPATIAARGLNAAGVAGNASEGIDANIPTPPQQIIVPPPPYRK